MGFMFQDDLAKNRKFFNERTGFGYFLYRI